MFSLLASKVNPSVLTSQTEPASYDLSGSGVWHSKDALQSLDFGDGLRRPSVLNIRHKGAKGETESQEAVYTPTPVHSFITRLGILKSLLFLPPAAEAASRQLEKVLLGAGMKALILRVLVVDDSEIVRRGICQILQSQADIEVIGEAVDGADAVRKARDHRPDVVLLDITMPVMNGFEAARLPSTLILMVSQFASAPFQREAITAGATAFVVKSNAASELIPALRKAHLQHAAKVMRDPAQS